MAKGNFTFDDLDKAMSKVDTLGSVMSENEFSKISEWIPTGNYVLNAQISGSLFKGAPGNRGIMFSGPSGCLSPDTEIEVVIGGYYERRIIEE